ncbi:hypothetical protein O3P69_013031 [Scylla paramamosain]|uniref:Uncharacterized protein n=1 Tax=Scylla paramamosain TaxID=85552 RepID=A0AAW0TR66_SCYPA
MPPFVDALGCRPAVPSFGDALRWRPTVLRYGEEIERPTRLRFENAPLHLSLPSHTSRHGEEQTQSIREEEGGDAP